MKSIEPTETNFLQYAVENYINHRCLSSEEFFDDLARVKYIKRLLRRYTNSGILRERLILNHLISFYNVFKMREASEMLFFKLEDALHPSLKTFLIYLNYITEDSLPNVEADKKINMILEKI